MGIVSILLVIIINFIFQTTLFQHFRIFGVLPNTTLIIVIVFAILWGRKRGAMVGFFSGALQDILFGTILGLNALIYMLLGFSVGSFENKIFKDNAITPIFFTVLGTIFYHLLYYLIIYATQNKIDFAVIFGKIIAIETVCNSILSGFAYNKLFHYLYQSKIKIKIR
ncbi:rod shape-determining protein MreD [Thermotalea metallivorans]|uniref:Uncharacterized protein n=1 Tax=Thermotalea metallivorans TaxID=520762 RepID=A0A140L938_9FIRM|nr:rod shape-determining protein MreD [Thermotalea metallivorans]KXG77063.1 hypothetical protein AN619_05910 [Thermotalea metallivorans]